MKKAKVIIPSLSLLCFSAVACVTGTVAWFSSVSNAHVATTNFSVKALEGSMNVEIYHGVGTKATLQNATDEQKIKDGSGNIIGYKGSDSIVVVPDTYGEGGANTNTLTHGSFDAANQKAYTIKPFSSISSPEYQLVTSSAITKANEADFQASGTEGYYHIFSFDMVFNYDFGGASTGKYNLFFDVTGTESAVTKTSGELTTLDTARGFRMAFYNETSKKWVAWSDLQSKEWGTTTPKTASNYIGTSGKDTTIKSIAYNPDEDGNLIYSDDPIIMVQGATGSAARKDCLGTFDASTSTTQIKIKTVAWYEGQDPNIVKDADLAAVNVKMAFYLKGYAE